MNAQEKILKRVWNNELPSIMEYADNGTKVDIYLNDTGDQFDFECAVEYLHDRYSYDYAMMVEPREIFDVTKVVILRAEYNGKPFNLNDMRRDTEELLRYGIEGYLNQSGLDS